MTKKIHIRTYGCQMNDYESDRTYRLFKDQEGYEWVDDATNADLVLFNTCTVRAKADQKALSEVGKLRSIKAKRPEMVLAFGGCLAQVQGKKIQKQFPHIDIVFGTHQWNKLPDLVRTVLEERKTFLEVDFYGWRDYSFLPIQKSAVSHPVAELVTIQNGCDKFCTFCLVPFARGRQVSRPHNDILKEIQILTESGVKEVTLLGQNVNAYGDDRSGEIDFVELLRKVAQVDGVERIRFMTSHPSNLTKEIIDLMAEEPKLCKHLHLPVQSGSDRILGKMKRDYTAEEFLELVQYMRKQMPDISLSTDFIVGFPSETEEEFQETLSLLREAKFDDSFSFVFSARDKTKAAQWEEEFVPKEVSAERLGRLQDLQLDLRRDRGSRWVGEVVEVLVEEVGTKGEGLLAGRTGQNRWVNFPGPSDWISTLREVEIQESFFTALKGVPKGKEMTCQSS